MTGAVPLEDLGLDIRDDHVNLDAARNEIVAFQVILELKRPIAQQVELTVSDLNGPAGKRIEANKHIERFLAHYVRVDPGGYTWGPKSTVLPWPDRYPDALVPFEAHCGPPKVIVKRIEIPPNANQAVWIDIYVPKELPPGDYRGQVNIGMRDGQLRMPLKLRVWEASLPDRPTIDAVGELYKAYVQERAGPEIGPKAWLRMAHCYQQLAHKHRVVFIERTDRILGPTSITDDAGGWKAYDEVYDPILTGSLFSAEHGYIGPGENTPVTIWRTPWPQNINHRLDRPFSPEDLRGYERLAAAWHAHSVKRKWSHTRFFAYILDEVDGPRDRDPRTGRAVPRTQTYLAMVHEAMRRLQRALDSGASGNAIDLLWTSHTNPAIWQGKKDLDLGGIIRLWCPNAAAADPRFLGLRARQGERVWFYHAGHPYLGVHSINASGLEMRTWGLIAARYGFHGQLMWAVNYGDPERPYEYPSYRRQDDRFGNGTLVYPGALLGQIGYTASPGPIPSMRLKGWRAGLQEAELVQIASSRGRDEAARRLLSKYIPVALAEGRGRAAWPSALSDWKTFHRELLELASN